MIHVECIELSSDDPLQLVESLIEVATWSFWTIVNCKRAVAAKSTRKIFSGQWRHVKLANWAAAGVWNPDLWNFSQKKMRSRGVVLLTPSLNLSSPVYSQFSRPVLFYCCLHVPLSGFTYSATSVHLVLSKFLGRNGWLQILAIASTLSWSTCGMPPFAQISTRLAASNP